MNHDIAQYMWQIQGRGPGATPHICGKKAKKWPNIMVMLPQNHCQFILCLEPREGKRVSIRPNSNPPNASFILFVFSLQLAFHDLYSVFHFVNPLTPEAFCPKCIFWTFWIFSGWVLAKLAKLSSQKGICNITACLSSTSILFYNMLAQACEEIKILKTRK